MSDKKIKVLCISDHPFSPSGVGTQTKYMIDALLKTGKFSFRCLGGAMKHENYDPVKTEEWGDDLIVWPVDGYGTPDIVRSMLRNEKPDILWFMTDPRFWGWLWEMEDEIRPHVPMVYYHVWDNKPYPKFNRVFYDSNDHVVAISKLTEDIVKNVASESVEQCRIPHSVNTDIFKKHEGFKAEEVMEMKRNHVLKPDDNEDKFVVFWNNRNARRKQSGTLIFWFKEFLDRVGKDNAVLIMHTDVRDQHGQDLEAIIKELGLKNREVIFSTMKVPPEHLSMMYNMADVTVNIADAEGFGLATLESLACETPIIVNMTGGLQEQVTDGEEWFGVGIEPSSKAVIGSQDIPWIYEDRCNKDDFINALEKIYNMSKEERGELGAKGRNHVLQNYNFDQYGKQWVDLMTKIHEEHGSWDTRKKYKAWTGQEVR